MRDQFFLGEYARSHGDYGHSQLARRLDVRRCVAYHADLRLLPQLPPGLSNTLAEDINPQLVRPTEGTQSKELPQSRCLQLQPANGLQISRYHSQQFSCGLQP